MSDQPQPSRGQDAAEPSPRNDVETTRSLHPALDAPVTDQVDDGDDRRPLDRIVFGVAAAVAIGFVLWGSLATESLSAASTAGLD